MREEKQVESAPVSAGLVRLVLSSGARLPLSLVRLMARLVGALSASLPNDLARVSDLNIRLCFPNMPTEERRRLVRRSLIETVTTFAELGALWQWPVERLTTLEEGIEGEDLLERTQAKGRGIVLLVPHLGNWEMLNHVLTRRGPLYCLYRRPRVAELDTYVRRARERTGCVMVPATPVGLRPMLRALGDGHQMLILPDQEPLKTHGVHAPFFGVPALTMTLVSKLLRRTGAEAVYAFAERRPSGRYRIRILEAPDGLRDGDDVRAASSLNHGVEACVRLCPEQYLWSYKRFMTAPPGEPTPYRAIWSRRRLRRNPWPPRPR